MDIIRFDTAKSFGEFKIMNAVNNGPVHKRHTQDQGMSNLEDFKALKIPYARNHDASYCHRYGGEHTVDISAIFPNFDADVDDPASYDFACTDEYIAITNLAYTETFFRLGQRIEHTIKKFNIHPPKDNLKWAKICEHIIMHYNEGWADGFRYGIKYWEIWNEPDLDIYVTDPKGKRTWMGTEREFFDLFATAAKHLKARFPELKIGGPALACRMEWAERFVADMRAQDVPMDFFSWHIYYHDTTLIVERAQTVRAILDKNGYTDTESILNEWNYIRGWSGDTFIYSLKSIAGIKGATFTLATMTECQKQPVDMLMYYDARPCLYNGLFNEYYERLKCYYAFAWFAKMRELDHEIRCDGEPENIFTLAGVNKDGRLCATVTYYTESDDTAEDKEIKLDFGREGSFEVYLLDENHDAELVKTTDELIFNIKPLSSIMIIEK